MGHGGRIAVDEFNRLPGHPEVMAIGDIPVMYTDDYPKGHPQMAQPAIQQAKKSCKESKLWGIPLSVQI